MLRIYTFGGLNIKRDDAPIAGLVSRKVEALLVYLACNPQEHSREALADLLWGDMMPDRSLANLRVAISNLQQSLAPYLTVTRRTIGMNPDGAWWVDVGELESAINAAEQQWAQGKSLSSSTLRQLEQALALYRGDFLDKFYVRDSQEFEDWMLPEQERLRARTTSTLYRLVCDSMKEGTYTTGIAQARQLLQIDPLSEETHRQLMLMLAKSGQPNAALAQYELCVQRLRQELDVEPDDETVKLYRDIQAGRIEVIPTTVEIPHNLPLQALPFVGRQQELGWIAERLSQADCRLLTLVGPGGTGKTRLAVQAASENLAHFKQGVYFVSLASLDSSTSMIPAIATALKFNFQQGALQQQLIDHLRQKEMLLVLDNFEHILDGAELLSAILSAAPGIKILATSREMLNLHEESILPIEGLEFPEIFPNGSVENYSAVQLFAQQAQRVQVNFSLAEHLPAVVRICQLVEGLPLGIELAAAWVRIMPSEQIAEEIERNLDFLSTSVRNIPERHRSIRILFEHAWERLSETERDSLMKLAVFRSGFDSKAAAEVANASLFILSALTEKSIVRGDPSGRYDMHELLRRYTLTKLTESGAEETVRDTHCAYFMQWIESLDDGRGIEQFAGKNLDVEYDNLRESLHWALQRGQGEPLLRISNALVFYWTSRGYAAEGRQWLAHGLELSNDTASPDLRARALSSAGILAWSQSDFEPARLLLEISLKLYRELNDVEGMSRALHYLGYVLLNTGAYKRARISYEEMLSLAREQHNQSTAVMALGNLGFVSLALGDYIAAETYLGESLAICKELGEPHKASAVLMNLGIVAFQQAHYSEAEAYYNESLDIAREIKHKPNIANLLAKLGDIAYRLGNFDRSGTLYIESLQLFVELGDKFNMTLILERFARLALTQEQVQRAAMLFGAADAMREALGTPVMPNERKLHDQNLTTLKEQLGENRFDTLWSQGHQMSLEEAVDYGLGKRN